ncbi:ABC transporter ATP-binding protein [Spiroplasma endosymbiont of Tipula paludosa]|uniref:ABC transporter ATP-binding protein n=1 Tax=Spiroplasma endosymbiont of Tipula paludosa TaxID=3066295 RepID=UPI0035C8B7B1
MNKDKDDEKNNSSKKFKGGFFKVVAFYYKRYLWQCCIIMLFTALGSICVIITPKITQKLVSPDVLQGPYGMLISYVIIIISLYLASGIFNFFQSFLGGIVAKKIEIDIRNKVLNNLVDLDMQFYTNKKTGEILTKVIADTATIGDQAQQIPISFLSAIFTFVGAIVILLTISIKLTIVALIAALTILVTLLVMFGIFKKITYKVRKVLTNINGDVTDRISVIRLIKSSGTETYEKERFVDIHKIYYKTSLKQVTLSSVIVSFMIMGISSLNIIILLAGIIMMHNQTLVADNSEAIPIIISFVLGINILIFPIMTLVRTFNNLANASTSSIRINELLNEKPQINRNLEQPIMKTVTGNIIFDNVSFYYPNSDQLILNKFNYHFEQGKSYAFVGETGVGKSTISKLLLRFYDPSMGTIYINADQDLKKINLTSYLQHVGYVEQEPQIFYGTFFENISYGVFKVTKEEVIVACKKAELHDFIIGLKNGYDTILGERGFILSGGQKQRLVIARMFLKNPEVLILDEATSSLDNIVEKEIQENLNQLMKGRTTFIIAHRLSTIKDVDEILVLEKDKGVVQSGNFETLKNQEGRFKALYTAGLMA